MAKKTTSKSKPAVNDVLDAEVVASEISATSNDVDATVEEAVSPDMTEDLEAEDESVVGETIEAQAAAEFEVQQKKSNLLPLIFGGLLAGGIGFFIASYFNGQDAEQHRAQIATLQMQINDLQAELEGLPPQIDLAPIEISISDLSTQMEDAQAELLDNQKALQDRVDVLEKQPSGDGTLQEAAIAAYDRDIQALRDQLADQQSAMDEMMSAATAQLQATQDEALAIEAQTVAAARAATARSAIARVQTALDTGSPFGAVLSELQQVTDDPLPEGLTNASEGVLTIAALSESFPEAARSALATARAEGLSGEDETGLSAFLKNQFSVRSVEPQDGESTDAVLSRAEDAVRSGRINDALAEVAALPEVARAALSEWVEQAELRAGAVDAANSLFAKFNFN